MRAGPWAWYSAGMRRVVLLAATTIAFSLGSAEARRFVCTDGQILLRRSVAKLGDCDGDRQANGTCVFISGTVQEPGIPVTLGTHRRRRAVQMVDGHRTVFVCRRAQEAN
jgi:hypothetical protein